METDTQIANSSLWDFKGKFDFVDEWFLMGSPAPVIAIWLVYITFVLKLGPAYMKNRPPFELRNTIVVYNVLQVFWSCFVSYKGGVQIWNNGLLRQVCISDSKDLQMQMMITYYYYFLAKVSELWDTVFFVLRKRYRQVSFLHVYHHSFTFMFTWVMIKFDPSEVSLFLGTINSFVHIIMYAYYALSAFPSMHKYLWWKAYITKLQLVQFMFMLIKATIDYKYSRCNTTFLLMGTIYFNVLLMIVLFGNFYIKAYFKKDEKALNGTKIVKEKKVM